ncbi:hypothetical protein D3C78_1627380 [compost metagenome]
MLLAHTPRVCWLKPIVQKDVTRIFGSAYSSARSRSCFCGTPVSLDVYSRSYFDTNLAKSSKVMGLDPPALSAFLAAFCKGWSGRRP